MPRVFVPRQMQSLVGGYESVEVNGTTVAQVIEQLERQFPGVRDRLCDGANLRPGLSVSADGQLCTLGLRQPIDPNAEIHFLPAIGGG